MLGGDPQPPSQPRPLPSPDYQMTVISPSTQRGSLGPGERTSTALPQQRSRLVTKKSAQVLDNHESDDSSDQDQRARSTAKLPHHPDGRRDPVPGSHFSAFHFPRLQPVSPRAEDGSVQDLPQASARRLDPLASRPDLKRLSQDRSPSTAGARQPELLSPRPQGFAAASQRGIAQAQGRRNSLAVSDALTPASVKKELPRRSVHAMALLNAASGHEPRTQPASLFRDQQQARQNSVISLASIKSGKQDTHFDLLSNEPGSHNLLHKQPLDAHQQSTHKHPNKNNRPSIRKVSVSLSEHHQSLDSSED